MARRSSWRHSLHSIHQRVTRSSLEYWRREDIEDLFGVKREAARNIMLATAAIENLGGVYVTSRYALLDLIEELKDADAPDIALSKMVQRAPAPRAAKPILVPIPEQFRNVSLNELPKNIVIEPGRIEIRGNAVQIIESLGLLARALEGELDLTQFCTVCDSTKAKQCRSDALPNTEAAPSCGAA